MDDIKVIYMKAEYRKYDETPSLILGLFMILAHLFSGGRR
jgi:hypothetical protein